MNIPDIPHEYVDKAKMKIRKVWALEDLDLKDPAIFIGWADEKWKDIGSLMGDADNPSVSKRMVDDPEYDITRQLRIVEQNIEFLTAGDGFCNIPMINMLHFGTGPLATAFGAKNVHNEGQMASVEPAVFTPEEVLKLKKPDLRKDGMCPQILERIEFYNEMTQGKIPVLTCDTSSPWNIATQIWNITDMMEAIYTSPEVVHWFLDLVTECIIEFVHIQMERITRNYCSYGFVGDIWQPHGWHLCNDTIVMVSPQQYREFYQPYDERIAREFGGIRYHCCMNHDFQLENMANTKGFMGFDADYNCNSVDLIEKALTGRGSWSRWIADRDLIKRFRGKAGLFPYIYGTSKKDALDNASDFIEFLDNLK
ncbi:MAG: uroporphyrinogen decarboxylase family protein [Saccharofermentanales bacterium]